MNSWNKYYEGLYDLYEKGLVELPTIPEGCTHNAHMFYIKLKDLEERTAFSQYLKDNGVQTAFHYIPLHSAKAGKQYGVFVGEDKYTTKESERLTRLPLYYGLKENDIEYVIDMIHKYWL